VTADMIIVGAGPGGAAAALEATRGGARVVLLERTIFPREKACGDGLTPRALDSLKRLGVTIPHGLGIRRMVLHSTAALDRPVSIPLETGQATVLPRFDLDDRIANAASQEGADLQTQSLVESLLVEEGRVVGVRRRTPAGVAESLRAPLVLLAEGSAGGLTRQAPLPAVRGRCTCFAARRYLEGVEWGESSAFEFVLPIVESGSPLIGYAWMFPLPGGRANVGIGFLANTDTRAHLREALQAFERTLQKHDPRFAHARPCGRIIGAPIRLGARGAASHAPGLLVVGDAAGLANPIWAEGISGALESGRIAGRTALAYLDGGVPLSTYAGALRNREPVIDRLGPTVPTLYSFYRHVAWDVPSLCAQTSDVSRAVVRMIKAELSPVESPLESRAGLIPEIVSAAQTARRRALWVAGRDRPFYGGILEELDRVCTIAPPPVALAVYAGCARAAGHSHHLDRPRVRRAAVCLELLRWAIGLLEELGQPPNGPGPPPPPRGRDWLASTLGLSLADRLLARSFDLTTRLPKHVRLAVARAHLDIAESRALRSAEATSGPSQATDAGILLVGQAARTGAVLAGASETQAISLEHSAREAAKGPPQSFLERFLGPNHRHQTHSLHEADGAWG